MNETTQQLIQKLAEKLGTTADHLWSVLIKQAPVSAACDISSEVIMISIGLLICKFLFNRFKKMEELSEGECFAIFIAAVIIPLVTIVIIIGSLSTLGTDLSGFTNPEYWALKQTLK